MINKSNLAHKNEPEEPRKWRQFQVIQGQYKVSTDENVVLSTILGSCIATCMWDPLAGVGGMNHFLLPGERNEDAKNVSYGAYAMELLINGLLKRGADRNRIEAKIFGGASMMSGLPAIGRQNIEFARRFLAKEDIRCTKESVGGTSARRIKFWPSNGRALQLFIERRKAPRLDEKPAIMTPPAGNDVELF